MSLDLNYTEFCCFDNFYREGKQVAIQEEENHVFEEPWITCLVTGTFFNRQTLRTCNGGVDQLIVFCPACGERILDKLNTALKID